jgi:hypothetical protein
MLLTLGRRIPCVHRRTVSSCRMALGPAHELFSCYISSHHHQPELEFLKSLWRLGTEEEEGYRTVPPGYICWRNSFLGIDSGAPYTFENTGSGQDHD